MNNNLTISGFKCFEKQTFSFDKITVLAGSNGTGKSSLIQALLLIRSSIEKNAFLNHEIGEYENDYLKWGNEQISLNGDYELSLGTYLQIFKDNGLKDTEIKFILDGLTFKIPFPEEKGNSTSISFEIDLSELDELEELLRRGNKFWNKKEFYYLNAERLGPRHSLPNNFTEFQHCGYKGEFTAQVILNNPFFKVEENLKFEDSKSVYLPKQIDSWLNFICPGAFVKAEAIGLMNAMIQIRNQNVKDFISATNIGFGISYSLPIIVTGLIAKPGCMFIVENPEAHLHPKGQANIGFFLGKVAEAGVKIIIETHSEHVINGLRRALLSSKVMSSKNINIYFFTGLNDIKVINIKSNGDLTDFPIDFFDQNRQDLLEILKLSGR